MKPAIYRRNSWLPTNGWFPTVFDEFLNNDMLNTASNVAPSVNVKETASMKTTICVLPSRTSSSTRKKTNIRTT